MFKFDIIWISCIYDIGYVMEIFGKYDENIPEKKLLMAIIESGIKEKDLKYFEGLMFRIHCNLLNFNIEYVKRLAKEKIHAG